MLSVVAMESAVKFQQFPGFFIHNLDVVWQKIITDKCMEN